MRVVQGVALKPGWDAFNLRLQVYLVVYDSGRVSLEHLLLSRHPSPSLESIKGLKDYHLNEHFKTEAPMDEMAGASSLPLRGGTLHFLRVNLPRYARSRPGSLLDCKVSKLHPGKNLLTL